MTRTYWTHRAYCARRALIAERLGIRPEDVSFDQTLSYDAGEMEPMEACDWPRLPAATVSSAGVLSSGPYFTRDHSGLVKHETYTVSPTLYAAVGAPFPDDAEWPADVSDLITGMGGGEW